jgi:transposase
VRGAKVMFIDTFKNNGKEYIRLVKSKRVMNSAGQKVARHVVIMNVGPLEKYDDGAPNYVERLRKSYRAGIPLIGALEKYCEKEQPRERYRMEFEEGNPNCAGIAKIYSYILIERIIEELGLRNFFSTYKGMSKIEYDVYGFAKLLIIGRVLNPGSKISTVRQNEDYHEIALKEYNADNVYDTLDFIALHKDQIIRRINTNLVKKAHRRAEIIYYDVTNFYFETDNSDENEYDEEGEVKMYGLRQRGVSKEERKQPIAQMGLFMDDGGIPIAIETFPGNTLDHQTLVDALKKNIDEAEYSRFILIGDRGVCTYRPNLLHLLDTGNGYIVAKSLLKSKMAEQKWANSEEGYIYEGAGFKYKSRICDHDVLDEKGKLVRTVTELVVVYWSEKFEKKQIAENKSFLEFLEKLLEHPENFRVTSSQAKSIRPFLKKEVVNEETGEVLDSSELIALIDMDKVNHYKENMGYYQLVTSELGMKPKEVIDKYHGLSRIEDQFRIMKSSLSTRPVFVRNKKHIIAHLLICTIALIVMRIIQNKIVDSGLLPSANDKDLNWTNGLSAERVQIALNKWQVEKMPGDLFRFLNIDDPDLKLILDAFSINIPYKLFQRGELKNIKTQTHIFM